MLLVTKLVASNNGALDVGFEPLFGAILTHKNGSMLADRASVAIPSAMMTRRERGALLFEAPVEVHKGVIVERNVAQTT